jgi:DNA adenine methylase
MISAIPYIGGKHRIAKQIAVYLHATGADCLVDVFGGSAAVLLNSGFQKRIYNDIDGDLVNFFRVLANDEYRAKFLQLIQLTPVARSIFETHYNKYAANGFSFSYINDPAERAFHLFYRLQFAFGGKLRSGGFTISTSDRKTIKEVLRYSNSVVRLAKLATFFQDTAIECLDFSECIKLYGWRSNIVLFVDPPYVGTENYYSRQMSKADHVFLAHLLSNCKASVVCSYYRAPEIQGLYPQNKWEWHPIQNVKNSQRRGAQKENAIDWILVKKKVGE